MCRAVLGILAVSFAFTGSSVFQSSTFAGAWASTSTPGLMWIIEQSPSELIQRIHLQERELRTNQWTLGGSPITVSNVFGGNAAQLAASVDGQFLVFQGPIVLSLGPASYRQTWRLDETGRLIVDTMIQGSDGSSFKRQEVFTKQP